MPKPLMTRLVDTWTLQAVAVAASTALLRLYRALGDDQQAALASQAGQAYAERAARLGLRAGFADLEPDETAGEARAWGQLVEAQAGLLGLQAMAEGHPQERSLQGLKTRTLKAFHQALRGYRVAFPEEFAEPGITQALETAADRCGEALALGLGEASESERQAIPADLRAQICRGLWEAAWPTEKVPAEPWIDTAR